MPRTRPKMATKNQPRMASKASMMAKMVKHHDVIKIKHQHWWLKAVFMPKSCCTNCELRVFLENKIHTGCFDKLKRRVLSKVRLSFLRNLADLWHQKCAVLRASAVANGGYNH